MSGQPFQLCEFEVSPFATALTGTITASVYEEGGVEPTTIIRTTEAWDVNVEWTLSGHMRRHLCGDWCLAAHLESIGTGAEYTLPEVRVKFDPCGNGKYSARIHVAAGTISPEHCGTLFLLAVTLTSRDACDKPGHIAAYCQGPDLMFYEGSDAE